MPIPKPKPGEEKNKYISRCVSFLMHEKREQKQALAICFSVWEKNESTVLDKIGIFINEENISTPMICNECGKKFKKKIGPKTYEVKCPKCGSFDTELE